MSNPGGCELCCLCLVLLVTGCQTLRQEPPACDAQAGAVSSPRQFAPPPETLERIMALDPEHVTEKDIREVLAGTPAPRLINIHGGLLPEAA